MDETAKSVWIVVPAFNEESRIAEALAPVSRAGYRIVVVDDGSADHTAEAASAEATALITHPVNLGQGAALQTGIEFALSKGATSIVTFDADGQHRPNDIERLLQAMETHGADFALGSRFLGTDVHVPWPRRQMLRAAILFTRLTTRLRITDTHNGLRAMTRRGASVIHLQQNRMAHASEILAQIADSGLSYVEVPVTIDYSAYSLKKGQRTGAFLTVLLDLIARRLRT